MKFLHRILAIIIISIYGHLAPSYAAESIRTEDLHKMIGAKLARDPDFLIQILGTNPYNDRTLAASFLNKLIEYSFYRTQTNSWLSQQTFNSEDELLAKWLKEHHKTLSFTLWILDEKMVALLHRIRNPIGEIDRQACTEKATLNEINELAYRALFNIKDTEISDLVSTLALTYIKSYVYKEESKKDIVAPPNIVIYFFREELLLWPEEDQKKISDVYSFKSKPTSNVKEICESAWLAVQIATRPKAKNSHIFTRSITDAGLSQAFQPKPVK